MMSFEDEYNFPEDLTVLENDGYVMFRCGDVKTRWMDKNDPFIRKITSDNLNPDRMAEHLIYELNIKNKFDSGVDFLNHEKYSRAIECFDEVIFYDNDAYALMCKSHALFGQKHFVNALRYYRKSVKANPLLKDDDYYRQLLDRSRAERDNFPKIKLNIYAGDEHFSRGEYEKALESYDKALVNPSSKFKDKILFKLLNKKAATYVKLNDFENAKCCFYESLNVLNNDCACFGLGYCMYMLNRDVCECFKKALKLNKKQLLMKAGILAELGFKKESENDYRHFLANHFKIDEDYKKAVEGLDNLLL